MQWTLNDDSDIDKEADGQSCYVLAGTVNFQNVFIWVNRNSFLIPQIQVKLGALADADDDQIKEMLKAQNNGKEPSLVQINAAKKQFKIKGSVTDTFANIQTNLTFAAADFPPEGFGSPVGGTNGASGPDGTNNMQRGGRATSIVNGGNGYGGGGGNGGRGGGGFGGGGNGGGAGGRGGGGGGRGGR
jgi:hypothetical protein